MAQSSGEAFLLTALLNLCLLSIIILCNANISQAELLEDMQKTCPSMIAEPRYQKVVEKYAFRMSDEPFKEFSCDILPVYYAFQDEGECFLDILERPKYQYLFKQMVIFFKENPDLAEKIHTNKAFLPGFSLLLVDTNDEVIKKFSDKIQSLITERRNSSSKKNNNPNQTDSPYLALKLLVPGLPPLTKLKSILYPKDAELLLACLSVSALENDQYAPFLSENPRDTLSGYMLLIREWGRSSLIRVLQQTPLAVGSLKPPMTRGELSGVLGSEVPSSSDFSTMQQNYVRIQHHLYNAVEKKYGAAWAGEVVQMASDFLPANLLKADSQHSIDNIETFLIWLTAKSNLFGKLIIPSACDDINNFTWLSSFFSTKNNTVLHLADWYGKENLASLMETWAMSTSPIALQDAFQNYEKQDLQGSTSDALFLGSLISVAEARSNMSPSAQTVLDNLIYDLKREGDQPWVVLNFLANIAQTPFFDIMSNRTFKSPRKVALHLLDYGYPTSDKPSLFENFRRGNLSSVDMNTAISARGKLSEDEILRSGRTFKDKTGVSPGELVDVTIDAATIIASYIATVPTLGTTTPLILANFARIATRLTTRQMLKNMVKCSVVREGKNFFQKIQTISAKKRPRLPNPTADSSFSPINEIAGVVEFESSSVVDTIGADMRMICPSEE